MPSFDQPLDLFPSGNPDLQIESLYRLRRSTHAAIARYGQQYWTASQHLLGRLYLPPALAELPAPQQPGALAADEAARIAGAHLYGLDETATAAAVRLGADMSALVPHQAEPGASRLVDVVAVKPPTPSGLLRWASGVGYSSDGIPLIACHWGPLPEGTWLAFWADNRAVTQSGITDNGWSQAGAERFLRQFGLLTFDIATILYTCSRPDLPADNLPPPHTITQGLALTSTVMASWALLTAPGAAHLTTRKPTPAQAAQDRRAGLTPRPATLATSTDVDTILHSLLTVDVPVSIGSGPWDQGQEPVLPALPSHRRRPVGGHLDFLYAQIRIRTPIAACVIHPGSDEPSHVRLTYRHTGGRVSLTEDETAFCWLTGARHGQVIAPVDRLSLATEAIAEELGAPLTTA